MTIIAYGRPDKLPGERFISCRVAGGTARKFRASGNVANPRFTARMGRRKDKKSDVLIFREGIHGRRIARRAYAKTGLARREEQTLAGRSGTPFEKLNPLEQQLILKQVDGLVAKR